MKDLDPVISIVMPVYHTNNNFLSEAIESIINQTYQNFEFIIISDDTLERTKEILNYYQNVDKRIRVYYQQREGLISSLNRGIHLAKGKYIARMDSDDISHPERLKKQIEFLDRHPDIGVCGTLMDNINADGIFVGKTTTPLSHNLIEWNLFFGCSMSHPTIMMRKEVIENYGYYNIEGEFAEDYELWTRLILQTKFANLSESLLKLRLHGNNVSVINIQRAWKTNSKTRYSFLKRFFFSINTKQKITFIESDVWGAVKTNNSQIVKQLYLLQKLYQLYVENRILSDFEKLEIFNEFSNRKVYFSKEILHCGLNSLRKNNARGLMYCLIALYTTPQITINEMVSILKKIFKKKFIIGFHED